MKNKTNEGICRSRYLRVSPSKVKLVIDLVRGKKVEDAYSILYYVNKGSSTFVKKAIMSAVKNAIDKDHEGKIDVENLYVKKIYVTRGPMLKRYQPRAMGRAFPIKKRTSHLTVVVDESK